MSEADAAQVVELQEWERNNRQRGPVKYDPSSVNYGPEDCDECGTEMHEIRRGYGFKTCVICAGAKEVKDSRYR